jgi:hypothetical protein
LVELAGVLHDEAAACARDEYWRAAVLLVAESVEAGLLATVCCSEPELRALQAWPTRQGTGPPERWSLDTLLRVALGARWLVPTLPPHTTPAEALGGEIGDAVRSLKEVRNLAAHPGRVIATEQLDFTDALLMAQLYPVLEGIAGAVFEKLGEVINALPDPPMDSGS